MELIEGSIETLSHSLDTLWDRFCKLERAVEDLREEHEALVEGVRYLHSQIIHDEPQVQQTTEEFVRVVRCKNCVWYVNVPDSQISDRCKNEDGLYDPKPDDYCMYGEKRENEKAH